MLGCVFLILCGIFVKSFYDWMVKQQSKCTQDNVFNQEETLIAKAVSPLLYLGLIVLSVLLYFILFK